MRSRLGRPVWVPLLPDFDRVVARAVVNSMRLCSKRVDAAGNTGEVLGDVYHHGAAFGLELAAQMVESHLLAGGGGNRAN